MGAIVAARLGNPTLDEATPAELAAALHPAFAFVLRLVAARIRGDLALPDTKLSKHVRRASARSGTGAMSREELERMAEGIVRLRSEILRRRAPDGGLPPDELTTPQALALRTVVRRGPAPDRRPRDRARRLRRDREPDGRCAGSSRPRSPRERPVGRSRRAGRRDRRGRSEHALRRERFVQALERFMGELSELERRQLADSLETVNRLLVGRDPSAVAVNRRAG